MSYNSLQRNKEYMGYGALTGLFRESNAQPRYTYRRDEERLREWQQSNSANNSVQGEIMKYISTTFNALQHFCIYIITPKFILLKSKCKSIKNHMDTASLCVLMLGLFALFIIILSRFIVDYQDIHNPNISEIDEPIDSMDGSDNIDINIDIDIDDPVIKKYDPITDLFRPTPIPMIDDEYKEKTDDDDDDAMNNNKTTMFDEWVLINSINWMDIKIGQIIKIKNIKDMNKMSDHGIKARIDNIDLEIMNINIKYLGNCWIFCHETIDIIAPNKMIYLIGTAKNDENTNANKPDIIESNITSFDPQRLYESINEINTNHDEFKEWVQNQMTEIQENNNVIEDDKVNDKLKDVLTDYLDDKMNKLLEMLENQQNAIKSIQIQSVKNDNESMNDNDNKSLNWDWNTIENRIDNKIESVVKIELESKFDNLAQQIAQEIAKEIISENENMNRKENGNENGNIIRGNDDDFNDENVDNSDRNKKSKIDWSFRVVSHSKLKINNNDIFHEYGYWIIHNLLSKWNQKSISSTYKPGDCTPLQLNMDNNEESNAYITIELYRAIYVKQISLYHYHSSILTQTAINAAPKDFQIWGSFNLTKWYDLGNFSYNYYHEKNTQYFDVIDIVNSKNHNDDNEGNYVNMDIDDDYNDNDDDDGYIIDHTSIISTNDDYDDYMMGFKFIAFRLLSNYGGSDYGCIYRLRVFGDIVS